MRKKEMMKIAFIILTFNIFFAAIIYAEEIELFNDDFESYNVGTFPSPNWVLHWNGAGNQFQIVNNNFYHSPTKSMQLRAQYNWAALAYRTLSVRPNIIYCELWMKSSQSQSSSDRGSNFGFYNPSEAVWGVMYGNFGMNNATGRFYYFNNTNYSETSVELDSFQFNRWYRIKLKYNLCCNMQSVWVDDVQLLNNVSLIVNSSGTRYSCFAISTSNTTTDLNHYDDIRVWYDNEEVATNYCLSLSRNNLNLGSSLCGESFSDTLVLSNTSSINQRIVSARFKNNLHFTTDLSSAFTLNANSNQIISINLKPNNYGTLVDSLMIVPFCGDTMFVKITATKDSINFALNNAYPDTLVIDLGVVCPGSIKDTTFTIKNISSIPTTFNFGNITMPFSIQSVSAAKKEEEYEGVKDEN